MGYEGDNIIEKTLSDEDLPNLFFKEVVDYLSPGSMLFPIGGKDNNVMYAELLGWKVDTTDYINKAKHELKASLISEKKYDVIALLLEHDFPENYNCEKHANLLSNLKPGGLIICQKHSRFRVKKKLENINYFELLFDRKCSRIEFENILIQDYEVKHMYRQIGYPKYLSRINLVGYNNI